MTMGTGLLFGVDAMKNILFFPLFLLLHCVIRVLCALLSALLMTVIYDTVFWQFSGPIWNLSLIYPFLFSYCANCALEEKTGAKKALLSFAVVVLIFSVAMTIYCFLIGEDFTVHIYGGIYALVLLWDKK